MTSITQPTLQTAEMELGPWPAFSLEARCNKDGAWYDCKLVDKDGQLLVHFDGYTDDMREKVCDIEHQLRLAAIPAEEKHCKGLVPGRRVSGFRQRPESDLWIDAEVVAKRPDHAEGGPCNCRFGVQWLNEQGQPEGEVDWLDLESVCVLDPRPLSSHPAYHELAALAQAHGRDSSGAAAVARAAAAGGPDSVAGDAVIGDVAVGDATSTKDVSPGGTIRIRVKLGGEMVGAINCSDAPAAVGAASPSDYLAAFREPAMLRALGGRACALCQLPTLGERDGSGSTALATTSGQGNEPGVGSCQRPGAAPFRLWYDGQCVHYGCALWSNDIPALARAGAQAVASSSSPRHAGGDAVPPGAAELCVSVGMAVARRCAYCGGSGASVTCSMVGCGTAGGGGSGQRYHLHCALAAGCKLRDADGRFMLCPMHCNSAQASGQQQRQGVAAAAAMTQQTQGPVRRVAHSKRVRKVRYVSESEGDDGDEGEEEDDDEDEEIAMLQAQRLGGGSASVASDGERRSGRKRKAASSFDDEMAALEERQQRQKDSLGATQDQGLMPAGGSGTLTTGNQSCRICRKECDEHRILLCDTCDRGYHTYCLSPPLEEVPEGSWHCPSCMQAYLCEVCGVRHPGEDPSDLALCRCEAKCHAACLKRQQGGGPPLCALCDKGLYQVEAVLGVRLPPPQQQGNNGGAGGERNVVGSGTAAGGQPEYYVKWQGRSYRKACWVPARTAERLAGPRVTRFVAKHRGAAYVAPLMQDQWCKMERVVTVQGGSALVKWSGLDYREVTWEPVGEVDPPALLEAYRSRRGMRLTDLYQRRRNSHAPPLKLPMQQEPEYVRGGCSAKGGDAQNPETLALPPRCLKDYQLEGVNWLLSKLLRGTSCLLGDEMGLGKTIQTAALLSVAWHEGLVQDPCMVTVPLSTLGGWQKELALWSPQLNVVTYHGDDAGREIIRRHEMGLEAGPNAPPAFHVLLTTYDMVKVKDSGFLSRYRWSMLVVDEAHRLKGTDSKLAEYLNRLKPAWRLLLTGTPLQNNLKELYTLFGFLEGRNAAAVEAAVLATPDPAPRPALRQQQQGEGGGSQQEEGGQEEEGDEAAYVRRMHAYLGLRMLRRLKSNVLNEMPAKITRKVGCPLKPYQREIYRNVLERNYDTLYAGVMKGQRKSLTNVLMALRQTSNHPFLISDPDPPLAVVTAADRFNKLVRSSGKLALLHRLLPQLLQKGHRVLVFCQMKQMLHLLQEFLYMFQDPTGELQACLAKHAADAEAAATTEIPPVTGGDAANNSIRAGSRGGSPADSPPGPGDDGDRSGDVISGGGVGSAAVASNDFVATQQQHASTATAGTVPIPHFRIDGDTPSQQRTRMIDAFNAYKGPQRVFLMSTRAGALGINLQAADTVIIYDPDFNPFVDLQAEGRAHRMGQQRTVMVYQLYSPGSVEERIIALAARKRKLESIVMQHRNKAKTEVNSGDLKSALLAGALNLMKDEHWEGTADGQQQQDGGADVFNDPEVIARLLDREGLQEGDTSGGTDAATLLGEVREGSRLKQGGEAKQQGGDAEGAEEDQDAGKDDDKATEDEQLLMELLKQRAQALKQADMEQYGRGQRRAARGVRYNVDSLDPGIPQSGFARITPASSPTALPGAGEDGDDLDDADYQPAAPAPSARGDDPGTARGDGDEEVVVVEEEEGGATPGSGDSKPGLMPGKRAIRAALSSQELIERARGSAGVQRAQPGTRPGSAPAAAGRTLGSAPSAGGRVSGSAPGAAGRAVAGGGLSLMGQAPDGGDIRRQAAAALHARPSLQSIPGGMQSLELLKVSPASFEARIRWMRAQVLSAKMMEQRNLKPPASSSSLGAKLVTLQRAYNAIQRFRAQRRQHLLHLHQRQQQQQAAAAGLTPQQLQQRWQQQAAAMGLTPQQQRQLQLRRQHALAMRQRSLAATDAARMQQQHLQAGAAAAAARTPQAAMLAGGGGQQRAAAGFARAATAPAQLPSSNHMLQPMDLDAEFDLALSGSGLCPIATADALAAGAEGDVMEGLLPMSSSGTAQELMDVNDLLNDDVPGEEGGSATGAYGELDADLLFS